MLSAYNHDGNEINFGHKNVQSIKVSDRFRNKIRFKTKHFV